MRGPVVETDTLSAMKRAFASFRRHAAVAACAGVVLGGLAVYGIVIGADLAIPYALIVAIGAYVVCASEPARGYSTLALAGVVSWGVGHMAGGIIPLSGDRTLYQGMIGPIHIDNVVHFVGFATAGLVWWEASRFGDQISTPEAPRRGAVFVAVWLAGMGAGAVNEVVEFIATLLIEDTNVGGYHNTGRDLIANMFGAATTALVAVRRTAQSPAVPPVGFEPTLGRF